MHVETIAADAATEARADVVLSGRELRDAVKLLASKAADKRATVPILASIYFEVAPDGRATLTATDLTAWASLTLQALSDDVETAPGTFAIEGAALHKVLSKAGKADRIRLTVNSDASRVRLKTGRTEMFLRVTADEFPLAPITAFAAEHAGELSRAQFMADLAALAPAMSDEYGRQHLHGISLQARDMAERPRLVMAATDGFKLAAASRPIPAGCEAWADCILPSRTVELALAAHKAAGAGDALILSQGARAVEIAFGNVSIYSWCVDATFPRWEGAIEAIAAPTDAEQGALFPDLLPEYPAGRVADMEKAAAGAIDWQPGKGALIGASAADPGMVWAVMYLAADASRHNGPDYSEGVTVEVEGDREYQIATTGKKLSLTKEQVAALCGDDLWTVLEFPGADGRPCYVSQWLWDDGASRFLVVGKDGRCPKAGAVREYVTRAEVEAAIAGGPKWAADGECINMTDAQMQEIAAPGRYPKGMVSAWDRMLATGLNQSGERLSPAQLDAIGTHRDRLLVMIEAPAPIAAEPEAVSAPETAPVCDVATPCATSAAETVESAPVAAPVEAEPVLQDDGDPIAAVRARLAEIEALLATLSAVSARPKRTPAHERMIRRAWDARKAHRWESAARQRLGNVCDQMRDRVDALEYQSQQDRNAKVAADDAIVTYRQRQAEAEDRAKLAEQIAEDHLRMREDMQRLLRDAEARAAAAEAENAQLWQEIEALTAPATPVGAIPVDASAAA